MSRKQLVEDVFGNNVGNCNIAELKLWLVKHRMLETPTVFHDAINTATKFLQMYSKRICLVPLQPNIVVDLNGRVAYMPYSMSAPESGSKTRMFDLLSLLTYLYCGSSLCGKFS